MSDFQQMIATMDYGQYVRALANPLHPIHLTSELSNNDSDEDYLPQIETREELLRREANKQIHIENHKVKKLREKELYEKHIEDQKNKQSKNVKSVIPMSTADKIKAKKDKLVKKQTS
jgi:hypothetical protein